MKPTCQIESRSFPRTDCFFHAGLGNWRGRFWSDDDEGSERRRFHSFSQQFVIEAARERSKEMIVMGLVMLTAAWPVIYMVITVVKLLLKGRAGL